jgi:predicted nuclease of predicted toxin-antitoxin system
VRFLADQDVYAITTRLLREWGHDVVTAAELNLSRAPDSELLERAAKERRILVTRDKDYGALVFLNRKPGGVILLRLTPSTLISAHDQLRRVLESHDEQIVAAAFIVVEAGQYRFRKVTNPS